MISTFCLSNYTIIRLIVKIVNVILSLSLQVNSLFVLATNTFHKYKVYKEFQKYIDAVFVFIWVSFFSFFLLGEGYSWSLLNIRGSLLALGLYMGFNGVSFGCIEVHWGISSIIGVNFGSVSYIGHNCDSVW